jgi:feruloyl esterase
MKRVLTNVIVAVVVAALCAVAGRAQGLMPAGLKPAVPNAKPVRSCESLATVTLPGTTIESAALDATDPNICRVVAITTHPPAADKVRIWIAIPVVGWNGRFLGSGGGGLLGRVGRSASIRR